MSGYVNLADLEECKKVVAGIISEELGYPKDDIGYEDNLIDNLGADSFDVVEIIVAVETAFDLDVIPDEDLQKLQDVETIARYVIEAKRTA
jgi:acyl carrier protein